KNIVKRIYTSSPHEYWIWDGLHQLLELSPFRISLPIPSPLPFPRKAAMTTGNCIREDAKITGITPAVFTLRGMLVVWPPIVFLPITFCEYCTGIFLTAS